MAKDQNTYNHILDNIARTQAAIDQARACLEENRQHLTDKEIRWTTHQLEERQITLNIAKEFLKKIGE